MIKVIFEAPFPFRWDYGDFTAPPRIGDLIIDQNEFKWKVLTVEWWRADEIRVYLERV